MRPRVRPAKTADIDALVAIEAVFPTDRLDRRAFRHAVRSPTMDCLVIIAEGAIAGYGLLQRRSDSRVARLTSVAVAVAARGHGLGAALLAALERRARRSGCNRLRLEVRADNGRARRLYEGCGYRAFATVVDYYEDGATALRFEKALD